MRFIAFQMPLTSARWFYQHGGAVRHVHVEVENTALARLGGETQLGTSAYATFAANRLVIERAARNIIDREGPNFAEPVRVTAIDL